MPFTPFHLGPASVVGLGLFRFLNLAAFLIASVIADIEPFCVFLFRLHYPVHGFLHTFWGGTIVALFLSLIVYHFKKPINKVMSVFKLSQDSSFKVILFSSIFGVYFHIFLDSFLYADIRPFWPSPVNPLRGLVSFGLMYSLCGFLILVGIILYLDLLRKKGREERKNV